MSRVDYDPVKAHEYYINYRKKGLKKGRSTKGLSQENKERWEYAKAQLKEQKKARDASDKERITKSKEQRIERIKEETTRRREEMTQRAKNEIENLKNYLSNLSPEQRKQVKAQIGETIRNIRAALSGEKKSLTENSTAEKKGIRQESSANLKSARASSKEKYEKDLEEAYNTIKKKNEAPKKKKTGMGEWWK